MNAAAAAERERNRRVLHRLIQAIEYHGRLGLALRGHRDSGDLLQPSGASLSADLDYSGGNFRALLQLMVSCNDAMLKEHFATAGRNATYISAPSQNALIECVAVVLKREIVEEIRSARFVAILADETTDFARQEQLTVCFRYVLGYAIRERFFCFALAPDLTGHGLASQLLAIMRDAGLDIHQLVGQGYDGASAMSGVKNGVQKHVMDECPSAAYVHCASHSLNLCLSKAAEVQPIRAAVTLMNDIAVFYCDSNK